MPSSGMYVISDLEKIVVRGDRGEAWQNIKLPATKSGEKNRKLQDSTGAIQESSVPRTSFYSARIPPHQYWGNT